CSAEDGHGVPASEEAATESARSTTSGSRPARPIAQAAARPAGPSTDDHHMLIRDASVNPSQLALNRRHPSAHRRNSQEPQSGMRARFRGSFL
ncbi:MAG TPA: hypothetical protein VN648_00235, partial [Candidatus Methylomirabilis sp.]|nr:hypothetical protein [Candidatus Methylomirabilis sp.]